MVGEREMRGFSGWFILIALTAIVIAAIWQLVNAIQAESFWMVGLWVLVLIVAGVCYAGLTVVNPNEAKVVQLAGVYKGTVKQQGFWWVNPLTTRRKLSLRVRNFESGHLKVNDHDGNPIEIAAVVVWKIVETYEALFNVNDYEHFVHVQSEAAVRNLATSYPYDAHQEGQLSLRQSVGEIADRLRHEIQERLAKAEIAGAMLRRQQAGAVIAARQKIVEGAVGMVEMVLQELSSKNVVRLDEERKATMVSNLLVVLCSEKGVEPVVNTGTLYQ